MNFFTLSYSGHYIHRSNEDENSFPSAIKSLMATVDDNCELRSSDCFSEKHNFEGEGNPQAVFNVLDALLKGSLDRLKAMRWFLLFFFNDLIRFFFHWVW